MPIYEYKAFDKYGSETTGLLDADSPRDARVKLRNRSVHVIELSEVDARDERSRRKLRLPNLRKGKRSIQVATVTRQLATLLSSGIPLSRSLKALIDQLERERDIQTVFRDVGEKVSQGASFGEALAFHPSYFSDLYVNMVRAGEASGNLDEVLHRLSTYLAAQNRLRSKVSAALAYPMIMVIIGAIVVTVLMTFVVPRIIRVVRSAKMTLPTETKLLITISNIFRDYWWALALGVFGSIVLYTLAYRSEGGRLRIDRWKLKIPIVGDLLQKQAVSRFAVSLSTLLKSGLPVLQSLDIVKQIVNNKIMEKTLGEVRDKILEGTDIATPIQKSGIFPPVLGYMISIGEQSGQLDDILEKVAANYDDEIDIATQRLTSVLEPIMIVGLAIIVGFIVLAIIRPILQVGQGIG
ncbi:MAG: type II secretion system inner membrane protein GspF [Planctomycetota bacterium]